MTLIGLVFLAALVIGLLSGRNAFNHVLASTIGFNDSSMLNSGAVAVSPFYAGAIIWILATCTIWRRPRERHGQGAAFLFVAFTGLVTALGPTLFAGMGVVASDIGLDQQAGNLSPLTYSTSNVAQMIYLLIVVTMFALNTHDGLNERHVVTGLIVGSLTALSSMIVADWPHDVFDSRENGFYSIETIRVRAQFAEPSHLGVFALVACLFFVTRLSTAKTLAMFGFNLAGAVVAGLLLSVSATGTALVGLPIAVVVAGALLTVRWLRSGKPLSPLVVVAVAFVPAVVALLVFRYWATVVGVIDVKIGSTSYSTRTFVDANAVRVLVESWFVGVGAGSNRASSLLLMILSQIGIIGTVLFLIVVLGAVRTGYARAATIASASGLVAFLCAAAVSFADLVSPIMWLLVVVCASAVHKHDEDLNGHVAVEAQPTVEVRSAHRPRNQHRVAGQAGRPRTIRP
jgi:hypothetical protein